MSAALQVREAGFVPDLASYDHIVLFTSGGKDSTACLLHLLDCGMPPERIELHHHEVDGRGAPFMDWPVTGAYVAAQAAAFGLPLYHSLARGWLRAGDAAPGCTDGADPVRGTSWPHEDRRCGAA
ncbi:hypothetical protein [Roseomonas mucosa]|uniref:hypothetical protein n=1 Tax=Roseomonas mucosa TaxID=207340 RepID=UPI001EF6F9B2|nr:hypothetical protein [Roseomonas mucosa]MCG7353737.1 hypothetical protein [Roseomonas mucosa]MCG7359129.1 hypothetical protein [Roseomonas mucosa]